MNIDRRILIGGLLAGGGLAAVLALWATLAEASGEVLPPASRWVLAAVCAVVWLATASLAWVALFDSPQDNRTLVGALLLSQLGKYVPGGGVVQIASMVGMSRNERLSTARLSLGLPVIGLSVLAVGGVATGLLAVVDTTLPGWARVACLGGLVSPLVLWRPVMVAVLATMRRLIRRIPPPQELPSQSAIIRSVTWTAVSLVASGLGYALLVQPLHDQSDLGSLTVVFVVAWAAGFLVLPLPGGLGVREAVLVGLVGGVTASTVGAAIAHRVINIGVELSAVALYLATARRRS